MEAVIGIRGVTWLRSWKRQMVLRQQFEESVAPRHPARRENVPGHEPQFIDPDTRVLRAYLANGVQHRQFAAALLRVVRLAFVIGLSGMAKQSAGSRYG